jgi:hypothetical protein
MVLQATNPFLFAFLLGRPPSPTSNFLLVCRSPLFGSYLPFVVLTATSANMATLAVAWRRPCGDVNTAILISPTRELGTVGSQVWK